MSLDYPFLIELGNCSFQKAITLGIHHLSVIGRIAYKITGAIRKPIRIEGAKVFVRVPKYTTFPLRSKLPMGIIGQLT